MVMNGQTTTSYLTVGRVAEMLSVSELTVRRKISEGEIPAVRLSTDGRGAVRIPEDGLGRWLEHRRVPAAVSIPIREGNAR
jgi:excisionase family DNA binding protein